MGGLLFSPTEPVTGEGLDLLRHKLAYSVADMCWVFGMPMSKWTDYVRKHGGERVHDESVEILARILDAHPDASPIPKRQSITEVFEKLEAAIGRRSATYRRLAILLGRHESGGSRWMSAASNAPPIIRHLGYAAHWVMSNDGRDGAHDWATIVKTVAKARGINKDI